MKQLLLIIAMFWGVCMVAQEQHEDGTWWDNNLEFYVKQDLVKKFGELEICIYHKTNEMCIENLMTTYEIRVFDANNKEIWNSLWTGKDMYMSFSKALPTAQYLTIRALRPFVINKLTGTRIYQDKAMELKYTVQ
jgi:hypothetical protein